MAGAFVDRYLSNLDDCLAGKERVAGLARAAAARMSRLPVTVDVNAADDPGKGSVYLTVTGTSAEAGDDGEAGRGNRVNGLITPYRPMTMESVAGKNPVTHVGKVYNVTAQLMTQALVDAIDEVTDVQCCLVSRIDLPVNEPQLVDLQLRTAEAVALEEVRARAEAIVREHLGQMGALWERRLRRQPPLI